MNRLFHIARLGWNYKIRTSPVLGCPPYQFTIEPTNICNLQCAFCPQSDPEHRRARKRGRLGPEQFALFLRRIEESGCGNRNLNLTLDGEPLLNPDFLTFVEATVAAGRFPVFATNALLLEHEQADRLLAAGPFHASIDFASSADIFEKIRGRKGDFATVRANLIYLVRQAATHPGAHLDIHDISGYCGLNPEESLAAMRALFPAQLSQRIRFDSRQFHNFCGHLPGAEVQRGYRLCPYPWTQMAVTHDGDCVACCRDTRGRSVLGNVFRDDVMTIWNGTAYREFRRNLVRKQPEQNAACRDCDLPFKVDVTRWKPQYVLRSLVGR